MIYRWVAILFAASLALSAQAQEAPDVMVKRVAEDVLQTIRSDKDLQAGNQAKVKQLIESKLAPNFDFTRMTALAMGKNWRSATPEQQKVLTDEFGRCWCGPIPARCPTIATTRWTTRRCGRILATPR